MDRSLNAYALRREDWIDRWRGMLMFSIVTFHVIGAFQHILVGSAAEAVAAMRNCIETFHTRGFFVIAGLLWHSEMTWGCFLRRKAQRLLVPYFIFGFCWAALFAVGGRYFLRESVGGVKMAGLALWKTFASVLMANGWPDGIGFRIINALWFLPCLFLTEIVYFWVDRAIPNRHWQLALLPLCYAFDRCFAKPDLIWCVNLLPRYMMCFILGRVVFNCLRGRLCRMMEVGLFVGAVLFLCRPFLLVEFATVVGFAPWSDLIRGMCGVFACLIVARILSLRWLTVLGTSTMGILVMHKVFILPFRLFHSLAISNSVIGVLAVLALTVGVCFVCAIGTLALRHLCPLSIGENR